MKPGGSGQAMSAPLAEVTDCLGVLFNPLYACVVLKRSADHLVEIIFSELVRTIVQCPHILVGGHVRLLLLVGLFCHGVSSIYREVMQEER